MERDRNTKEEKQNHIYSTFDTVCCFFYKYGQKSTARNEANRRDDVNNIRKFIAIVSPLNSGRRFFIPRWPNRPNGDF